MMQQIAEAMKSAMKAGDKPRLSAIRMFRSALKEKEIELGHDLRDDEVIQVAVRLVKQRKDAALQYRDAGRNDLADKELFEAEVIGTWLPRQMSDREIQSAVEEVCQRISASSMKEMGKVMGALQKELAGRADMRQVSAAVKQRLMNGS